MHHHKTYIYVNFQQNQVKTQVLTVHISLFAKNRKLHKFATMNIQANFGTNRSVRYQITAKKNYLHRPTDRWTDIGSFFEKNTKNVIICNNK